VNIIEPRRRICVLGGSGFVGSELVSRLASAGHWLRVPTRAASHAAHLSVLPTVEIVTANVQDPRVLGELLSGMDVAINLVGILNERAGATFESAHVELVAKLIDAARIGRVRRLLHMSALGASAADGPSRYLRSKGRAESLLREAASFLDCTIFRPSVIFGPQDSLTNRFAALLRLSRGILPLARPRARFAPIDVEDAAEAFTRALRTASAIGRTYELCGPEVFTLAEIVRLTAQSAELPCHIVPLPDLIARLQGIVFGLLPGKPFSLDNFRSLTRDSVCSENGCAALGIEPQRMAPIVSQYLGGQSMAARFNRYRAMADR
jgi:NADH dehydrogenase